MHEQTTVFDPVQTEVEMLWAKIMKMAQDQAHHEYEMSLVTRESDSLHRENQALRREIAAMKDTGKPTGCGGGN